MNEFVIGFYYKGEGNLQIGRIKAHTLEGAAAAFLARQATRPTVAGDTTILQFVAILPPADANYCYAAIQAKPTAGYTVAGRVACPLL